MYYCLLQLALRSIPLRGLRAHGSQQASFAAANSSSWRPHSSDASTSVSGRIKTMVRVSTFCVRIHVIHYYLHSHHTLVRTKHTHTPNMDQNSVGEELKKVCRWPTVPRDTERLDRHIYCGIRTIYSSLSFLLLRLGAPPPTVGLRERLEMCRVNFHRWRGL